MTVEARDATGYVIRDLRWWDIEVVHRIEVDLFTIEPWSVGQFWNELAGVPETRDFFVAERSATVGEPGIVVGYACLATVGGTSDVQTIAVARDAQGRGVGRRLLSELLERAQRRGSHQVMLEVRAGNDVAVSLYRSVGFEEIHRRPNYYAPGVDAVVMELRTADAT